MFHRPAGMPDPTHGLDQDMTDLTKIGELDVHPLALGGNVFGWTADRDAAFRILDAYAAAGGDFLDTADSYSAWIDGNRGGESCPARLPTPSVVLRTRSGVSSVNCGGERAAALSVRNLV